eukprot:2018229-Rhodomonas_salina.2
MTSTPTGHSEGAIAIFVRCPPNALGEGLADWCKSPHWRMFVVFVPLPGYILFFHPAGLSRDPNTTSLDISSSCPIFAHLQTVSMSSASSLPSAQRAPPPLCDLGREARAWVWRGRCGAWRRCRGRSRCCRGGCAP